jgi:hypothetical protein
VLAEPVELATEPALVPAEAESARSIVLATESEQKPARQLSRTTIIRGLVGVGLGTFSVYKAYKYYRNDSEKKRIQKEALNYLSKDTNTEKEFNSLDKLLITNKEFILNALIKDYKVWNYIKDEKIKNNNTFIIKVLDNNTKIWDLIEEDKKIELLKNKQFKGMLETNDEMNKIVNYKRSIFSRLK